MQLQWVGTITTDLPVTSAQVAQWVARERPELVRRLHGAAQAPTAAQVETFMGVQPHFAQTLAGLYAQAHGLLPAGAELRVRRI